MNKQNIIISCDTTIALSKEEILANNLNVIPLNTIVDGVEYHDTVDINSVKLCELMKQGGKVSTSTPTIGEIEDYFDNLFEKTNADVIIHFTISSKLSSMFSLFTTVCKEKYQDKVVVVDSYSLCQWMANQVIYAKRLAENGCSVDEIISKVKECLYNTEDAIFIPESLEYLKRGGRISPAVASIANFIGVIPVLTFSDGEVGKKGVTRSMQKAFINTLKEWQDKYQDKINDYQLMILSSGPLDEEKKAKAKAVINEFAKGMELIFCNISLNVTAHAGPGTIGLGLVKKF